MKNERAVTIPEAAFLFAVMRVSHFVENPHIIKEKERDTMSFSIISIRQLASWQAREGTILIDLREREEYQEEHIKGAVNIPYERWEQEKRDGGTSLRI